jgi:hypothetical protein
MLLFFFLFVCFRLQARSVACVVVLALAAFAAVTCNPVEEKILERSGYQQPFVPVVQPYHPQPVQTQERSSHYGSGIGGQVYHPEYSQGYEKTK